MKILVAGSNGFIGKYLVSELEKTGHHLVTADLSTGTNVCDWSQVEQFESADVVIHLANLSYVPASFQDPKQFYESNYLSTLNLLEFCRKNKSGFIYLSSYVYGTPQYQPINENHPVSAYNPYAQSKVICESLCEGYNRDFGLPVTVFRPFNIYGVGQHPDFLIPTIIRQAEEGEIVIRDERPKRDYVHVTDIVGAILTTIKQFNPADHQLKKYNLGSGKSYSVREIIDIVRGFYDHKINYICTNEFRQQEVLDTIADISLVRKELAWEPAISISEGIQSMIDNQNKLRKNK